MGPMSGHVEQLPVELDVFRTLRGVAARMVYAPNRLGNVVITYYDIY